MSMKIRHFRKTNKLLMQMAFPQGISKLAKIAKITVNGLLCTVLCIPCKAQRTDNCLVLSSIFCVLLCFSPLCFSGHPCDGNLSQGEIIPSQVVELPSNNNFQFIPRFLHYLSERLICQTAAQVLCSVPVQETIAIGLSDSSELLLH